MKKTVLWILGIVVVIVLVSLFVRSGNNATVQPAADATPVTQAPAPLDQAANVPTPAAAPAVNSTVKEFTVHAGNFFFAPKTLSVKKGDTVKITLVNDDGFHDLRIDEFNVATPRISGGAKASVTFTATKTGTFEYYCSVGDHRAMGMKGTLTVTP